FHLLCASTYCALDMSRLRVYNGRMWKWGYFTRAPEKPTAKREKTSAVEILWCGRMLKWKQVDHLLKAAVKLKKEGLAFHINIVGEGAEESSLKKFSLKHGLDTHVTFHGSVSPTEVLHYMAASHIYVLPSNYQEGWGAVVNEAMSSGCCVVSSSGVGSAGFLISSGENGFIYRNGNISELSTILSKLIRNPEIISDTGTAALETMKLWTPEIAARRFMELVSSISSGAAGKNLFAEGPCSRAEVIKHLNEKRE
ncbi:MAG: glycosyltransferase family 4 protein, partial [Spirochaetales bacterium]|nr:glycosyltransferase family 4 protein [Spirochaetales bacterium]